MYRRAYDLMDPVVADEFFPTLGFGDENKFHRPFRRGEDKCGLVEFFVSGNKPHVPRRDPVEIDMLWWPRIAATFHGVSS